MSDERLEAIEPDEIEAAGETDLTTHEPMTEDGMDAVIGVAAKMESYEKAMNTIINAIIRRSYVGDWVCHAKGSDKPEDRKANIGSAAAERIAVFLGIQERNWTPGQKLWSDDRSHFTWMFEADFGFGKRWIHAVGRASSQDKFFGFANGQWKALGDVKEDDVRMAAFRACRKEGVRGLLGLRAIPITKLKELGYDESKVRFVGFEDRGKSLDASAKTTSKETGMASREIIVAEMHPFTGKNDKGVAWHRWEVRDKEGVKWTLWGNGNRASLLRDACASQKPIKIEFQTTTFKNTEQYEIIKVNGEVDQ